MSDEPTPPIATPSRRPLAWVALGVLALGVAGGGAAAVALTAGDEPDRIAVTAAAAEDEGTAPADDGAATTDERPTEGDRPMRRPGAHGTVTGVDGSTVTVEDDEGTATTVTTDDETSVLDVAEGAVSDLAEGDSVVVMAPPADEEGDAVTARRIVDLGTLDPDVLHPGAGDRPEPPEGAPAMGRFGPTVGTVAAVDGATLTVTTEDGDVVVTTDEDTAVSVVTEIAVADLAEGDTIAARGETDGEGTVAADVIIRGDLEAGRFGPGFGGPGRGGPGFGGGADCIPADG